MNERRPQAEDDTSLNAREVGFVKIEIKKVEKRVQPAAKREGDYKAIEM